MIQVLTFNFPARERVVQTELQPETGRYKVRVREETHFAENTEFRDDITEEQYRDDRGRQAPARLP